MLHPFLYPFSLKTCGHQLGKVGHVLMSHARFWNIHLWDIYFQFLIEHFPFVCIRTKLSRINIISET